MRLLKEGLGGNVDSSPAAASSSSVLIAGGYDSNTSAVTGTAELYDFDTRQFSSTGSMTAPRVFHTATRLNDGRVLIAGGASNNDPVREGGVLSSAEFFDPAKGTFMATGSMNFARAGHTAMLLPNGKVLVAGGLTENGDAGATAELYDPGTGKFSKLGNLTDGRVFATATLLESGQELIAGGEELIAAGAINDAANLTQVRLGTAEIYKPESAAFQCIGGVSFLGALCSPSMLSRRAYHTATLLQNGRVLIAGGDGDCRSNIGKAELYDPAREDFVPANDMVADRQQHTATRLTDGEVLLAGGLSPCGTGPPVVQAEIYDPAPFMLQSYSGAFSTTGSITEPRARHTAVLLPAGPDAGQVLIAGGSLSGNATAELYVPGSETFECVGGASAAPPACNPSMTEAREGHTATLLVVPPTPVTKKQMTPAVPVTPASIATPIATPPAAQD
ncbi:MAG: kelch repeat-containing protein [Candidatus Binataceae bacterium]